MKKIIYVALTFIVTTSLSGCSLIGDIFKGGLMIGIILAVIIGLIIWALSSFSGHNLREDINKPVNL